MGMAAKHILGYLSYLYNGDWDKIYKTITDREKVSKDEINNFAENYKGDYICIMDKEFPECSKSYTSRPPFVIYYKGDISLLNDENHKTTLGVVGDTSSTQYGINMTEKIVNELSKPCINIATGFERQIDRIAINTALDNNRKVIAVLGRGFNTVTKQEDIELIDRIISHGGLVITEFPDDCKSSKSRIERRDTVVAMICKAVLITELKEKHESEVYSVIKTALRYGKDIACVPHCYGIKSGCNQLIKDGATLIDCNYDILYLMNIER